ncbi:McrB family protein [Carnobacterium sp. TMP28]|uniref:McrB family protein n=1 Tax=Carnobacterium sp. TMP28 TaxID=3397060 RepID=UPI0039E012AA
MNHKSNVDMIGVLANEPVIDEDRYVQPITINKNNDTVFTIIPLSNFSSDVPEDIRSVQCFSNELLQWGYTDSGTDDHNLRKSELADFLSDFLIIFKPEKRKSGQTDYYYVAREIRLVELPDDFSDKSVYEPIPVFKPNDEGLVFHDSSIDKFEERLTTFQYTGVANNVSREEEDYPTRVIWEDEDNRFLYTGIIFQNNNIHGVRYKINPDEFKKYLINDSWDEFVCTNGEKEDILFVPNDKLTHEDIGKLEEILLLDDLSFASVESKDSVLNAKEISEEVMLEEQIDEEEEFMQYFIEVTTGKKYNLYYDEKDLYNFHTAMKTGNLVILAGLSGTGKSKLVKAYGDALKLKEGQSKIVPVRPFWQDDSDFLGYADTINSIYRAGDSGVVDTLIDAQNNTDQMYIICFDEMNLAKVEHYFSQFLSVLEMDNEQRKISLYNQDLANRFYNSEKYPHEIKIPRNVLFVGTVNLDESTFQFSDKVLDRANVINLNMLPFSELVNEREYPESKKNAGKKGMDYEKFREFSLGNEGLIKTELVFFEKLHKIINESNRHVGIGWRIIKQIDEYLKNIPVQSPIKKDEAIDLQIVQRILTKVRGSEGQLSILLGDSTNPGELLDLLDANKEISSFSESRKVIQHKIKELKIHGYTM